MKRGLSYVDWTISVGIFIIYIISIFVIMGPAFKQDYSDEYLGKIVKEGLKESTSITIKRIPFYMVITQPVIDNGPLFTNLMIILDNLPLELHEITSNKQFAITNQLGELVIRREYFPDTEKIKFIAQPADFGLTEVNIVGGGNIYYSDKEFFSYLQLDAAEPFEYDHRTTYGITEELIGLDDEELGRWLNDTVEYLDIQELFKYPKEKDFNIQIFNDSSPPDNPQREYMKKEPTDKDEVKVLMWSDWVIYPSTQRAPVMVVVRTW
ncbi:hypothetical protein HOG16_03790 [Candidatus Woesearchaeota archaeon]|nr:hypothetical protein [Candidatus Woesearchaeota archaeon]